MYIKFFHVYANTLTRSAPYLIGIFLGFFIDRIESMKDGKLNLSLKYRIFFWLYVSQWIFFRQMFEILCEISDCKNNATFFYVFEAGHKVIWSLSVGWIIVACHFGVGSIVNKILSNKAWIPIAKISLSLYLIHPAIQLNYVATHPLETNFELSGIVCVLFICNKFVQYLTFMLFFTVDQLSQ